MTNLKMQNSAAYKTFLAYATGVIPPKKARKFKKPASPSKKAPFVAAERSKGIELLSKSALLEDAQLKKDIKRSKRERNIHQAGGSSEGAGFKSEVPNEPKGKSIDTSKGTGLNLRVLDVSKEDSSEKATISTTSALDSTTLTVIHQRLSDLENEAKTLRNVDHSLAIRVVINFEVPTVVKEYFGTSLDDTLHNKRTLFETMTKTKSFNKNTKHKALYHALMESILEDEDAIDKGVADKSKKRKLDDADRDEGPPARSNQGLKRKKTREDIGNTDEPPIFNADPKDWFKKLERPPTPDPEWNKCKTVDNKPTKKWLSNLAKAEKPSKTFDDLMSTPIDFSAFAMNCLLSIFPISLTAEEGDDPDDVADIFKIEGTGTYEEYELNNHVIRDLKQLWLDNRVPYQLCEAYHFKNGVTEWPTCSLYIDGFCNDGELPRMVRVGSMIFFLRSQVRPHANFKTKTAHDPHLDINHIFDRNYDTSNAGNTHDKQGHEECVDDPTHEPSVCKIRRFEMMKYSFNVNEEYIALKESEYLNHSKDNLDAYRELLRIIDEGWVVNMDEPNITMEEYIRFKEEKAQKHRKVFNWETAKYGKIWYDEDVHGLRSVEIKFLAIAFNDRISSEKTLSCEPMVSSLNDEIDFKISFDDSDDED
nr:hypothetical protein [Tanacetum cinerariifolium]